MEIKAAIGATTSWEQVTPTKALTEYLKGTHYLWSRLFDGEAIFTVLPQGKEPSAGDGGYRTIDAALRVKGLATTVSPIS